MAIVIPDLHPHLTEAIRHYWTALDAQAHASQERAGIDTGNRGGVTGGKQMDGFSDLVRFVLEANGIENASIHTKNSRVLPGYFRASKDWDIVIVHDGRLIAAVEFKSQRGSFGNNFNNRAEEAIGSATDLWTAYREGAFGKGASRPWLGWVMLLEDSPRARSPVSTGLRHFDSFPEFIGASYATRYEILLRKLVLERCYDSAAFIMSKAATPDTVEYSEPASDLTMRSLLISLAGHASAFVAQSV